MKPISHDDKFFNALNINIKANVCGECMAYRRLHDHRLRQESIGLLVYRRVGCIYCIATPAIFLLKKNAKF